MSEFPNNRTELDDSIIGSWIISFAVFSPESDNSRHGVYQFSNLFSFISPEFCAVMSFEEKKVWLTLTLDETTQRGSLLIASEVMRTAFEGIGQPFALESAKMNNAEEISSGERFSVIDVSLDALDIERELVRFRL